MYTCIYIYISMDIYISIGILMCLGLGRAWWTAGLLGTLSAYSNPLSHNPIPVPS